MHVNKREQQTVWLVQLFSGRASRLQDVASACQLSLEPDSRIYLQQKWCSPGSHKTCRMKYNVTSVSAIFPPPISHHSSTALYILPLALCGTLTAMNASLPWENLMKVIHCHPVLYWDVRTPWINGLHEMFPLSASSEKLPLPFAEKVNIIKWRLPPTKWEWHCRLRAL